MSNSTTVWSKNTSSIYEYSTDDFNPDWGTSILEYIAKLPNHVSFKYEEGRANFSCQYKHEMDLIHDFLNKKRVEQKKCNTSNDEAVRNISHGQSVHLQGSNPMYRKAVPKKDGSGDKVFDTTNNISNQGNSRQSLGLSTASTPSTTLTTPSISTTYTTPTPSSTYTTTTTTITTTTLTPPFSANESKVPSHESQETVKVVGHRTEVSRNSYPYLYSIEKYDHRMYGPILKKIGDIGESSFYVEKSDPKKALFGCKYITTLQEFEDLLNTIGFYKYTLDHVKNSFLAKEIEKVKPNKSQQTQCQDIKQICSSSPKEHDISKEPEEPHMMTYATSVGAKEAPSLTTEPEITKYMSPYKSPTVSTIPSLSISKKETDQPSTLSHPLLTLLDSHKHELSQEGGHTHVAENTKVILLVGETGAGKTTFINSIANYFKNETLPTNDIEVRIGMIQSIIDPDTYDDTPVFFGPKGSTKLDDNERATQTGESSTQDAKIHDITIEGQKFIFIDTPGMGDSRGVPQDKINMDKTIDIIKQFRTLTAVCVLMSPNTKRPTEGIRYCINTIFDTFRKPTFPNVLFCFTKTRGTAYKPGDTLSCLREILNKDLCNRLNVKTVYCYENEGFIYALKMSSDEVNGKIKENLERERNSQEESWKKSRESALRMVDTVRELSPVDTDLIVLTYTLNKMIFDLKTWEDTETENIAKNLLAKLENIRYDIDTSSNLDSGKLFNDINVAVEICHKEIEEKHLEKERKRKEEERKENELHYGIPLKNYRKLLSFLVTSKHEHDRILRKLVRLVGYLKGHHGISFSSDLNEIIDILLIKKNELLPEPTLEELNNAAQTLANICNGFHNTAHLKYKNYYGVKLFEGKLKMHYVSILGKMHYVQNTMKDYSRGYYLTNSSIEWKFSTNYKNPTTNLEKDLVNAYTKKDEMLDEWTILKGRFADEKLAEEVFIVCAILHNWLIVGN